MIEIKSYTCPNCGANTINTDNCEYCGSLLVRFIEKGIDLKHSDYLNNSIIYPGLIQALNHNLELQNITNESIVTTDIIGPCFEGENDYITCILRNGNIAYLDKSLKHCKSNKGICVTFNFCLYLNVNEQALIKYNREQEERCKWFEALDCYPLFTKHISHYTDEFSYNRKAFEYFIDFGEDTEGAAKLISKVWKCVFNISPDAKIEYYTNAGMDNVEQCRKEIFAELTGFAPDDINQANDFWSILSPNDIWEWLAYIILAIGILVYIFIV